MAGGGLVEGGGDDFGIDGAHHVGHFFWALIDEEHHEVGVGMVAGNGVGNVLHEHGLTRFRLRHDEGTLPLANGGEEVDYAARKVVVFVARAECKLLFGEQGHEVLEGYAVAHLLRQQAIDVVHIDQCKELFALGRYLDLALHHVAGFKAVLAYLGGRHVDVVGRSHVVVVRRTEEAKALGHHLEHAAPFEQVGLRVEGRCCCTLSALSRLLPCMLLP